MGWLVLAAGASSRFQGDKLLSPFTRDGHSIIEATLKTFRATGAPILVVTRSDHNALHNLLDQHHLNYTICPDAHLGMGHSIAWGVKQVQHQWSWLGIVLADMPAVKPDTLEKLIAKISDCLIVAPVGQRPTPGQSAGEAEPNDPPPSNLAMRNGHPVLFGKHYFNQLAALKGDSGARAILQKNMNLVIKVWSDDAGIFADIDTQEDYLHWLRQES